MLRHPAAARDPYLALGVHFAGATPQSAADRWSSGMAGAGQKIAEGVDAVRTAPGAAAARQADVWAANTQAARQKFQRRVQSVSLSDWQNAMKTKGVPRIAEGASASKDKFASFMTAFLPHLERTRASLPPRGNFEANIARMTAFVRGVHGFQYGGQ